MLCCTSAPPTTGMSRSPESTGHAVAATKHTWGFTPARAAAGASSRSASTPGSSGARKRVGPNVALVDTFQLQGGVFDAGVRAHPALLLGRDRVALPVGVEDRPGEVVRIAARDDLPGAREDAADVRVIGAHD